MQAFAPALEHGSIETMLSTYGISGDDLDLVRKFGEKVRPRMESIVAAFYRWLEKQPEYLRFFGDGGETVERVSKLQLAYWYRFMGANVDEDYLQHRRRIGETHARIGLSLNVYFAAMNMFLNCFCEQIRELETPAEAPVVQQAITKLIHLDTMVVVDTYNRLVEEMLTAQSKALVEMSTPVTQIWSGILLLPLVGIIDSRRAGEIVNASLAKIAETQARIFILDISGVGVVDTAVANHLIKITRATRLMGCESTISGISPSIAQTIVDLGIDVGKLKTTATMRDALADAFSRLGMQITQTR
jgi:rsbT co-antagonist protein RsbR